MTATFPAPDVEVAMPLVPPAVPPDVLPLWTAGTALVTASITQLLKTFVTPIHNSPDVVKSMLALFVAMVATMLGHLVGGPLPNDLPGAVGVVVSWLAASGIHAIAKKAGVVKDSVTA